MDERIDLGKWKQVRTQVPNVATCFEFVISWTNSGEDMAQLARICSGAIGAVLAERLPRYRPSVHKPSEYGHICLNRMLENDIPSSVILKKGTEILQYMSEQIPSEKEVEEESDFLSEPTRDD